MQDAFMFQRRKSDRLREKLLEVLKWVGWGIAALQTILNNVGPPGAA